MPLFYEKIADRCFHIVRLKTIVLLYLPRFAFSEIRMILTKFATDVRFILSVRGYEGEEKWSVSHQSFVPSENSNGACVRRRVAAAHRLAHAVTPLGRVLEPPPPPSAGYTIITRRYVTRRRRVRRRTNTSARRSSVQHSKVRA